MTRLRFAVVLVILSLVAVPVTAQEDAGFGEVIDIELVNVDLWVTDSEGLPVRGLTADDFRVSHDGDPVTVTHFVEIGGSTEPLVPSASTPGGAEDSTESENSTEVAWGGESWAKTSVVVFFDQLRTHPGHVAAMVEDLEQLLATGAIEPEQILVLRQDSSLHVEAPFGSSRRDVTKAFRDLREIASQAGALQTDTLQVLRQIQESWRAAEFRQSDAATVRANLPELPSQAGGTVMERFRGSGSEGTFESSLCLDFLTQVKPQVIQWSNFQANRAALTLENLRRVGGLLAGLPGVKSLIYVSDGLDVQPGAPLVSYLTGLCPAHVSRLVSDVGSESMGEDFVELTRDLNSRRVTVYALQAGGLTGSSLEDASQDSMGGRPMTARARTAFETRRKAGEREGLQMLAEETGGKVVVRRNELAAEVAALSGDLRPHYSLAYPLPAGSRRTSHRIEVEAPGERHMKLRYRKGYGEVDADRRLADRLDGALYLGLVDNPLQLRLGAAEIASAEEGKFLLPLRVMVPAAGLVSSGNVAQVKLRVVARHLETQSLAVREQTFRVNLPDDPGDQMSVLPVDLKLDPGAFTVAVGVRDEGSRIVSVVSTEVTLGG